MNFHYKHFTTEQIIPILIVILAAFVFRTAGRNIIDRLVRRAVRADRYETKADERKREDTIISILHTTLSFILWVIVALTILSILQVNVAGLLAGAGVFGVVIGLGAQNTIKDFLAGIFILAENQYRVGDIVTLSGGTTGTVGTSGVVEDITLRITKLRDQTGTLSVVRNGEASIITNRTFQFSAVVVDVTVSFDSDLHEAEEIINQVGIDMLADEQWKSQIIEPIRYLRTEDFVENGAVVRCYGKVKPASQWDVAGDFRRRLTVALKDTAVSFAMPQREIHEAAALKTAKKH
ncbi:MAG: Potassium efflux system KefA protein / Small-conductance mechanosensitive channel [Candidatus Saccharibacteria bacterium]|nr:Potassium efflux system KefA protein / Small-conductance mechanosensitive channel [Candidatus Saccharibacteria bacterium]